MRWEIKEPGKDTVSLSSALNWELGSEGEQEPVDLPWTQRKRPQAMFSRWEVAPLPFGLPVPNWKA